MQLGPALQFCKLPYHFKKCADKSLSISEHILKNFSWEASFCVRSAPGHGAALSVCEVVHLHDAAWFSLPFTVQDPLGLSPPIGLNDCAHFFMTCEALKLI